MRSGFYKLATKGILLTTLAFNALAVSPVVAAEVTKSPGDHRQYRSLTLPNDLQVLLVSDDQAKKSAASLDINIGSGSNPEDRAGLAHFLEHMLFLGTKKYPNAAEYKQFISTHGGSNNAFTSYDHTNYFFDINPPHFEQALDRFAQFFIAPLFNEELVTRERQAVESEYSLNLRNDGRRHFAARRRAYNPEHPAANFSVGSQDTLGDRPDSKVRDELIAFYEEYYSANIMRLVLVGPQSLDDLETWAKEKFSAIVNRNADAQHTDIDLYPKDLLPAVLGIVPEREFHQLILHFPIPDLERHRHQKPLYLIAHLLGDEGVSSLLSLLKEKGWAEGLSARQGASFDDQGSFEVAISLTPSGFDNRQQIVATVFDTISLIKKEGVQQWVFEEQKRQLELSFRFQEPVAPSPYARTLAGSLHRYTAEEVLSGPYRMDSFDESLIRKHLDYLVPANLLIIETSPLVEATETEQWFQVPYTLNSLDPAALNDWTTQAITERVKFPSPNPFLPEDLAMLDAEIDAESDIEKPLLMEKPGLKLWFRNDTDFGAPRANLYFSIRSPKARGSARNVVMAGLFVEMIREQLNEFSYPATLAGLDYNIYRHHRGIGVRITGYNDKQSVLLETVMRTMKEPDFNEPTFERLKRRYIRSLNNRRKNDPSQLAVEGVVNSMRLANWTNEQLLAAAADVEYRDLSGYSKVLLAENEVVSLVHGNVNKSVATDIVKLIEQLLTGTTPTPVNRQSIVKLENGKRFVTSAASDHNDSAAAYYIQLGERDIDIRAQSFLLARIIESPFFHELRTVKQLGYSVQSFALPLDNVPGMAFSIQSPTAAPEEIIAAVDEFLASFNKQLDSMDAAEFASVKAGLLNQINRNDQRLADRSNRYWTEIDTMQYEFDTRKKISEAIENTSLESVQLLMDRLATDTNSGRVIAYVAGAALESEVKVPQGLVFDDVDTFKKQQEHFPPR